MKEKWSLPDPDSEEFGWAQAAWDAARLRTPIGIKLHQQFVDQVLTTDLGVKDAVGRAGIFAHEPDSTLVLPGALPKFVHSLTGVTRDGRTNAQILAAYASMTAQSREFVASQTPRGLQAALHVQMALDNEIEVQPGVYNKLLDFVEEIVEGAAAS